MKDIAQAISSCGVLFTAAYLWCHGVQNTWVIVLFIIGLLMT